MPVRPPLLSRQQFLKKNPGGRYNVYRKTWINQRQRRAQPPPLPTYESLLRGTTQIQTPAQLEARANRMAQTQQTYQQKLIDQEYAQARADALEQMKAYQAAGREAAAMNAGILSHVGESYAGAASGLADVSSALSAAMAGATGADVAASDAALGRIGAPGVNVPAGQAAVENYRGGTLGSNLLSTTGVASQLGLGSLISAQNLRSTQEAQAAFTTSQREAQRAKMNAIKALAAGRPQAAMQFLQQLEQSNRQQVALVQGLLGAQQASATQSLQNKLAKEKFAIDKSQVDPVKSKATGFITYVDGTQPRDAKGKRIPASRLEAMTPAQKAALALQVTSAQIDWAKVDPVKSMALGYVVDERGRPVLDASKNKISAKKLLTGTKSRGRTLTPGQMVDLMDNAQRSAENFYYGYAKDPKTGKRISAIQGGEFDPDDPTTYGTGRLTYDKALRRLMLQGVPPRAARAVLDELYKRGEANRPIFTDAEARTAKKKLGKQNFVSALAQIRKAMEAGNYDVADRMIEEVLSGVGIGFGR